MRPVMPPLRATRPDAHGAVAPQLVSGNLTPVLAWQR